MTHYSFINFLVAFFLLCSCATSKKDAKVSFSKEEGKSIFSPIDNYSPAMNIGDDLLSKAIKLIKEKKFERAHEKLNSMLKKKMNVEGAYFFKAYAYIIEKKFEMARFIFDKIKDEPAFSPAINNNLGVLSKIDGSKEEALYFFNKALDQSPYYYPALVNRGFLYADFGLYEKAYVDLSNAVYISKEDYPVLLAFGVAQRGIAFYEDAKKTFDSLRKHREALYNLGLIYFEDMNNMDMAAKIFEEYISSGPASDEKDLAMKYLKKARGAEK